MFYKFYSDWAYLTKDEIAILCSVASMGGSFEGSITGLYKLTQIGVAGKPNETQRKNIESTIFHLEEKLFVNYDTIGPKKIKIDLIKRGMEIEVHENLYNKIKQVHKPSVAWQNIIKIFLFFVPVEYLKTKHILLGYVLNIETRENTVNKEKAKSTAITRSKNVLEGLNCMQYEQIKEAYIDENGKKQHSTIGGIFRCAIPPEYKVK